jgi:hypothetical protein
LLVQELFSQQEDSDVNLRRYLRKPVAVLPEPDKPEPDQPRRTFVAFHSFGNPDHGPVRAHKPDRRLLSVYELQSIEGFDLITIYKLMPFVTVYDSGFAFGPAFAVVADEG